MRFLYLFVWILLSSNVWAQLSLDSCLSQSLRHFQFEREDLAIVEAKDLAVKNAGKSWYPQVNLDYNSTIQNQQIEFPSAGPGAPTLEIPLDFHRLLINFSQNIYNGNISAHKKRMESYASDNKLYELNIQKNNVRAQVVKIYMSLLLVNENKKIIQSNKQSLQNQLDRIESAEKYGAAQLVDAKTLEAEVLSVGQREVDLDNQYLLLLRQLSLLMGIDLPAEVELNVPVIEMKEDQIDQRPEMQLLKNQINLLETQKKLTGSSRLPNIRLYGSAGAGNPGYNIIDNNIQPMGMVGIGVRWNIWDWNETGNKKSILVINQQNIENAIRRQSIVLNADLNEQRQELTRLNEIMKNDEEILEIREEVVEIKSAQLDNGIITSSEYIVELNKRSVAEHNLKIHELQLIQAKINYNIIAGN